MDDLLERTRAACLERARAVRTALQKVQDPGDRALDAALRELHAVKGEAVMGGLRSVSKLAHALESLLIERRQVEPFYLDDVRHALRVLTDILANTPAVDLVSANDIEDLLREVEISAEAHDSERRSSVPPAAAVSPARIDTSTETAAVGPQVAPRADRANAETNWVRVDIRSIDDLSNLISEMVVDLEGMRSLLAEAPRRFEGRVDRMVQAVGEEIDGLRARVARAEARAWSLRLVPLAPTLQGLAEHLENLGRQLGKQVRVEVHAGDVALERSVVEVLREPLLHLGRNAVDHGIELPDDRGDKPLPARIRLHAESQGAETLVAVEDDGAGLDVAAIRQRAVALELAAPERAPLLSRDEVLDLIFVHGFSECHEASEISGRGIGLSAVRSCIERLGGAVRVASSQGRSSRFELVLPAAVARERVLVVESAGLPWAIPSRWVRSVVRDPDTLQQAREKRMLRTHEGLSPARPLSAWLGAPREEETAAILVSIAGRRTALLVARTLVEGVLLRLPTDPLLEVGARVVASGTLDDGRVAFFLRWAEVVREATQLAHDGVVEARHAPRRVRILMADDSPVIRDIVGEVLTGAGFEVTTAEDGKIALERLARDPFDLVITDIEMPRMTGLELLQAIREKDPHLPVVMLTTRSKPEHRREAALLGANAYIAKSEFHGDTLMEVVRRFVDLST